jgi:hypothetical protein
VLLADKQESKSLDDDDNIENGSAAVTEGTLQPDRPDPRHTDGQRVSLYYGEWFVIEKKVRRELVFTSVVF